MAAWRLASGLPARKPGNAWRVNGSWELNGTLNPDCNLVRATPEMRFDGRAVRGWGVPRAFDRGLLLFSQKQTAF